MMQVRMKDPVVQEGAAVLRGTAKPVAATDIGSTELNTLINKMKDVLAHEEFGVAIAAPQLNVPLRLFVVSPKVFERKEEDEDSERERAFAASSDEAKAPSATSASASATSSATQASTQPAHLVFINPEITRRSRKKLEMSEGCLSVRGVYGTVLRHEKASVKALDEHGVPFIYHGSGLLGHIFQHEVDHLDGVLFTDKAITLQEESDDEPQPNEQ